MKQMFKDFKEKEKNTPVPQFQCPVKALAKEILGDDFPVEEMAHDIKETFFTAKHLIKDGVRDITQGFH